MPRCIECGTSVQRIVNPETSAVERCPVCGHGCDTYYEFGSVQQWIDIVLLQRSAWMHALFNETNTDLYFVMVALFAVFVEAVVVRTLSVLKATAGHPDGQHAGGAYVGEGANATSLQLVHIIQSPPFAFMSYPRTLPPLFFYACCEFVILVVVAIRIGSFLRPKDEGYEDYLGRWVRTVSLASATKLSYCLFLVWRIPVPIVPIVDVMYRLCLARGLSTLALGKPWHYVAAGVLLCFGARLAFRHLTSWSPQLLI